MFLHRKSLITIQDNYNWIELAITCSAPSNIDITKVVCTGLVVPSDDQGRTFTFVKRIYNVSRNWQMEVWYVIEPNTGSRVVTADTGYICGSCSFHMMVEQIQGIEAED